jgi:large subunit ribosomal protein L10
MPSTRKQREETVAQLSKDLENVQGLVVAEYKGVKTPELNELRGRLRPLKSTCRVVKNTLAKRALKNSGIAGIDPFFDGQSALIIQKGDAMASFKVVVEFERGHENYKIRAGYMNGQVLKPAELKVLAALPPKNVLIARFLWGLQSPVTRFAGVLSAPLRYLVCAFDQVAKQNQQGAKS